MNTEDLQKRLDSLISSVQAIKQIVAAEMPVFPQDKMVLVAENKCLQCEKPIKGRSIQGCDESCHKLLKKAIADGKVSEFEAIASGLMLPPKPGGKPRKQTSLRSLLAEKLQASKAAGDAVAKTKSARSGNKK